MTQHKKMIAGIVLGAGAAVLAGLTTTGWHMGWGPFAKLHDVKMLKKLDTEMTADLFLCQLSTNDASQGKPLGEVGKSFELEAFDTSTVAGAIEYIIAYAGQTWNCPVLFYTNPRYSAAAAGERTPPQWISPGPRRYTFGIMARGGWISWNLALSGRKIRLRAGKQMALRRKNYERGQAENRILEKSYGHRHCSAPAVLEL